MEKEEIHLTQGGSFLFTDSDRATLQEVLDRSLPKDSYLLDFVNRVCTLPEAYVGVINLPSRTVCIMPKLRGLTMRQVQMMYFFVMADAWDLAETKAIFDLSEGTLNENLAKKFIQELGNVIQKGLPHLYEDRDANLEYIKGKLKVDKTLENMALTANKPFNCEYEETSMKNPVSKTLGAALYKIEFVLPEAFLQYAPYLPYCTAEEAKRLSEKILPVSRRRPYYDALFWADRIIRDLQIITIGSETMGSSFIINLYWLFQEFCYKALKEYGKEFGLDTSALISTPIIPYEEASQYNRSQKIIQPDILYKFDKYSQTAEAVLDSKCKQDMFQPSDIYELEFYSSCLLVKKCLLLYPRAGNKLDKNYNVLKVSKQFTNVYQKELFAVQMDVSFNSSDEFIENMKTFCKTVSGLIIDNPFNMTKIS